MECIKIDISKWLKKKGFSKGTIYLEPLGDV